ncbi:hypothetical protein PPERSA_03160 [Pseudocohnilembus persalinus]|uniref:Uncharacterized protein n=1 Tax=Pseudocohnilembus persalinus TaxID=266149 RepID=A0A0V0QIN0_PSEPJ|nr:hypothetical protein PPERSA_03160 [Pseudocohnilembus persalinus]|eukprot:KRX02098.1 hypothetical protein PPERSA_03160 [Pseudocohnilembus persalinus]
MKVLKLFRYLKNRMKSTKTYKKFDDLREEMKDRKMNRTKIGEDRLGNTYYQYYSPYGLPYKREVEFIDKNSFELNDQAYYLWLNKRQESPPTEEEVQKYYFEEAMRIQRGIEWDKQQEMERLIFLQKRKEVQQQYLEKKMQNQELLSSEEENLSRQHQHILQEAFQQDPITALNKEQKQEEELQYKPKSWNPTDKQNLKSRRVKKAVQNTQEQQKEQEEVK